VERALTIAGSDSGGGAGIQADLKTFAALGVWGTCAITALTAQNTRGVQAVHAVPAEFVRAQLDAVMADIGTDAAKTGMLASAEIIGAVVEAVRAHRIERLVVDPVMRAASGDPLLEPVAEARLARDLLPLAAVATPNVFEAGALAGLEVRDEADMEEAARRIAKLGPGAVVVKGGRAGGDTSTDVCWLDGAIVRLETRRRVGPRGGVFHGAGCCFSAALAAQLARGAPLVEALREAKRFVTRAIERAAGIGGGMTPVAPISSPPGDD
jgi:hydroxymethylpyrimidine/phosphomethylpyrimidine kinase